MNLPIVFVLILASALVCALAARVELRATPRAALATDGFLSYGAFLFLFLLPVAVYFYAFHGDWFLGYTIDVTRVPSAVVLVGFVALGLVGAGGFALGARLVRSQRDSVVAALAAILVTGAASVLPALERRLTTVGTYAQFHGEFGLSSWTRSSLLPSVAIAGVLCLVGLVHCAVRIHVAGQRASRR